MEEKQKEQDLLDRYLSQESTVLDKSYLDTHLSSEYLDSNSKQDIKEKTKASYLDRINDPDKQQSKSYLDKINDPQEQKSSSYLETISFDYLNQDTTIKEIKIDYGYFEKPKNETPKAPTVTEQAEDKPVTDQEPQPEKQEPIIEAPESQTVNDQKENEKQPVIVDMEKVIDHKPQLPRTIWYLTEGSHDVQTGIKSFSQWQSQPFRGFGKLKKSWTVEAKSDLTQVWPISLSNSWFIGPYMRINPETGEIKNLKKPLIPEITDSKRIFGAMKLDENWWRVAINLDTAEFSGKFMPASKPRGNFKAINKCLLYLDAREGSNPSLCRLNPESCEVIWKIESNGVYKITNAGTAFGNLWIFQNGVDTRLTCVDPVKGLADDYKFPKMNPSDCFDFWGKLFFTTTDGILIEYDQARKTVVHETKVGQFGWTTTFMHALEDRVYLKSISGAAAMYFSVDPLSGDCTELAEMPRKDGCRYYQDTRNLKKIDVNNDVIWSIDDYTANGVMLEDEYGVLVKSGTMLSLWR